MERFVFLLLIILSILLFLHGTTVSEARPLASLFTAPSNARVNIEGALGVFLNQGKQSILLSPTDITFGVNSSPLLSMTENGNVGIGVTTPSQKLHVNPGRILLSGGTSALYFSDTNRGIIYSKTPGGQQTFTSNAPKDGLALYGYLDGCLGTTDVANGGSKSILSWTSNGAVTINPPNTQTVFYPLAVYGYSNVERGSSYIYMNDPATAGTGQFRASIYAQYGVVSGAYGFLTLSDQRIKKEIQPCRTALDVIQQIEVVQYEHIDKTKEKRVEYGVVAQQLKQCLPTSVHQITECIPNVYQRVERQIVGQHTVHLFFQERVPSIVGCLLKLIRGEEEIFVRVLDKGTHSLIVDSFPVGGEIFAYGTREEDFLVVDKLQLGVLALQGVKELMREVQELRSLLSR